MPNCGISCWRGLTEPVCINSQDTELLKPRTRSAHFETLFSYQIMVNNMALWSLFIVVGESIWSLYMFLLYFFHLLRSSEQAPWSFPKMYLSSLPSLPRTHVLCFPGLGEGRTRKGERAQHRCPPLLPTTATTASNGTTVHKRARGGGLGLISRPAVTSSGSVQSHRLRDVSMDGNCHCQKINTNLLILNSKSTDNDNFRTITMF